jgi:hypothetical protein
MKKLTLVLTCLIISIGVFAQMNDFYDNNNRSHISKDEPESYETVKPNESLDEIIVNNEQNTEFNLKPAAVSSMSIITEASIKNVKIINNKSSIVYEGSKPRGGDGKSLNLPIEQLEPGTYFIRVETEEGTKIERLIISK